MIFKLLILPDQEVKGQRVRLQRYCIELDNQDIQTAVLFKFKNWEQEDKHEKLFKYIIFSITET